MSAGWMPCHPVGLQQPQLQPACLGQALEDVAVGRELAGRGDHDAATGARLEGRVGQTVEVDGRRVADDDLARAGAQEGRRDLVADARRELDPGVPATHDLPAPFVPDEPGEALEGRLGQTTERVAVEVDRLGPGDLEGRPQTAQGIERIEALRPRAIGRRGHPRLTWEALMDADSGGGVIDAGSGAALGEPGLVVGLVDALVDLGLGQQERQPVRRGWSPR